MKMDNEEFRLREDYKAMIDKNSSSGSDNNVVAPTVSFEEYIDAAEAELAMNIDPSSSLYTELKARWQQDYPSTSNVNFSASEIKKIEQAGLLGASRQQQLDHLYGGSGGSEDDNPFND